MATQDGPVPEAPESKRDLAGALRGLIPRLALAHTGIDTPTVARLQELTFLSLRPICGGLRRCAPTSR